MPRNQPRSTAARLHSQPVARRARKRRPSPVGAPPDQRAQWTQLLERQRDEVQRQRTAEDERLERRRRESRTYQGARAEAHAAAGPAPSQPHSASIRRLRADGARQRVELRRRHRTERASLAVSDASRFAFCVAAPTPSASCSGNTAPRSTSRPSAPSSKPNTASSRPNAANSRPNAARLTAPAGPADPRPPQRGGDPDRGRARKREPHDLQYHERRLRASRDERTHRRANAAHEAWMTTLHAHHRSEHRLLVYENAVRAVGLDRSRRSSKAPSKTPYSPSLEQVGGRGGPASGAREPRA